MNPGNLYRAKAADMAARARADRSPTGKAEYARLCLGYLRLAEKADQRTVVEKLPKLVEEIRTRSLLHRLLNQVSALSIQRPAAPGPRREVNRPGLIGGYLV